MDRRKNVRRDVALAVPTDSESDAGPEKLQAKLREINHDLIERDRQIAESRKQIEHFTKLLAQRDLNLEAREYEIAGLKSLVQDLNSQIRDLNGQVLAWKAQVTALVESSSWKWTEPARRIKRFLKAAYHSYGRAFQSAPTDPAPSKANHEVAFDPPVPREDPRAAAIRIDSEMRSMGRLIEALQKRNQILEQAYRDTVLRAVDTTAGGTYIHRVDDKLNPAGVGVKAIAFYESREGGRINWIEVSRAAPRYLGHYQPHRPDLGYYESQSPETFERQVELATRYGISAFCFRTGGCSPEEILHLPPGRLLSQPSLRIAFCISCTSDTVQSASANSLTRLFADERYIKVEQKPLVVLSDIRSEVDDIRRWRDWASNAGMPGLYLIASLPTDLQRTFPSPVDAILIDPTNLVVADITSETPSLDASFRGHIYSYASMMETDSAVSDSRIIKNVVTSWDTEPVSPGESRSFAGATPALYARWLERSCRFTLQRPPGERFLFITSWNNWSAGAHLEPDQHFGYAYLHGTANVLRHYYRDAATEAVINKINSRFSRTSDTAVIFHCFYEDLIDPIFERYFAQARDMDMFVTLRPDASHDAVERMQSWFPNVFFLRHENRGRDMRPFLVALRHIRSLGYSFACKIHTKKTPQGERGMGNVWRETLLDQLLGAPDSSTQILRRFQEDPSLGLLIPKASVEDLRELRHYISNTFWLDRLLHLMGRPDLVGNYAFSFPAGSMYWLRVNALDGFDQLIDEDSFEIELGQRDGTLAHALERLVALYALQKGYSTQEIDVTESSAQ